MDDDNYNIRKKNGVQWKMTTKSCFGLTETSGFTVDNLDTKGISEARNHYEEIFIRVRELLVDKPWCCDSREDVLSICQAVCDNLRKNLLIRKDT